MSFDVPAAAYDRFMGRYSSALAPLFADFSGVEPGESVLDVGCGPGSLTGILVERVGSGSVTAVDPSESFLAAIQGRFPDVDVHLGSAESLPFADARFDRAMAQLVVHHMTDPVAGIRDMARVTLAGGVVAACVWDHVGGRSPVAPFWEAYRRYEPGADPEALPGTREGELVAFFGEAGIEDVEGETISFQYPHGGFDDWWAPFSQSVGPVGRILGGLDDEGRRRLEEISREVFPSDSETLDLSVWAARGVVGDHTM